MPEREATGARPVIRLFRKANHRAGGAVGRDESTPDYTHLHPRGQPRATFESDRFIGIAHTAAPPRPGRV
jgi:hypothetical protein